MEKQDNKSVEMTDDQMMDAIGKDLQVTRTLFMIVLENPEILKDVTEAIVRGFRRMQKYQKDLETVNGKE